MVVAAFALLFHSITLRLCSLDQRPIAVQRRIQKMRATGRDGLSESNADWKNVGGVGR